MDDQVLPGAARSRRAPALRETITRTFRSVMLRRGNLSSRGSECNMPALLTLRYTHAGPARDAGPVSTFQEDP